jgi:hypothetical protein
MSDPRYDYDPDSSNRGFCWSAFVLTWRTDKA